MKKHLILLSLLLPFLSCSEKPSGNVESFWDDLDVVAEKVVVDGDSAILCDYNKIKGQERKTIPFAELFEDYEVVKLDNDNDKALLSLDVSPIALSENYIGCYCYEFYPFKLFRRSDGKYLRDIGAFGQGPGEYTSIVCAQIDEKNNRVYILPHLQNKLFIYDLEGNFVSDIPLPSRWTEGFYWDSVNNLLYLGASLGNYHAPFIYIMDAKGNILKSLESSEKYDLRATFFEFSKRNVVPFDLYINYRPILFSKASDVKESDLHTNQYDPANPKKVVDYLCHYLPEENRLQPQFSIKNLEQPHHIYDFPTCYVVETWMVVNGKTRDEVKSKKIIVDKKTLRGCEFDGFKMPSGIVCDVYLAMLEFRDRHFLLNIYGSELALYIERLDRSTLSSSEKAELERLENLIDDGKEDCNIVFIAKMKEH